MRFCACWPPAASWMAGPLGVSERSGIGPRFFGTVSTSSDPSGSQRGDWKIGLTPPVITLRACALAVSSTWRSIPSARVLVKDTFAPSGDQAMCDRSASAGRATARTAPLAMSCNDRPTSVRGPCRSLIVASSRIPASFSIGLARSATGGSASRVSSSSWSPSGETETPGLGARVTMSATTAGGVR